MGTMETNLEIRGMHCDGCAGAVKRVLGRMDGVTAVEVDLARGRAKVSSRNGLDAAKLVAAVAEAGYDASLCG
jgi:copper chaperone